MPSKRPALWPCPDCGRSFANPNQTLFCSDVKLDAHFEGKPAKPRTLFDALLPEVEKHSPVKVLPQKTRIALQVRMSFAAIMPRGGYLRAHLVLAERHDLPCFSKVETFSPRNHLHAFELRDVKRLSSAFKRLIGAAYRVGCQEHLR